VKIKPVLAWYDLWVGAFWDRAKRKLYILPLPCIGIVFELGQCTRCDGLGFVFTHGYWFGLLPSSYLPTTCPECHGKTVVQLPTEADRH
jgi:hypothetical protein